jgi:hypothetical protein
VPCGCKHTVAPVCQVDDQIHPSPKNVWGYRRIWPHGENMVYPCANLSGVYMHLHMSLYTTLL